jgi:hypothetical protein
MPLAGHIWWLIDEAAENEVRWRSCSLTSIAFSLNQLAQLHGQYKHMHSSHISISNELV